MRGLLIIIGLMSAWGNATSAQATDKPQGGQACTLKISGMVCSACAGTVERAAKKIAGVKTAKASRPKDVAEITYDPTKTSPDAIAKALMRTTPFQAEVSQSESKG